MNHELMKAGWAIVVVAATVIMTRGLDQSVRVEGKAEATGPGRRGPRLVLATAALLAASAAAAPLLLGAPLWVALALGVAVVVFVGVLQAPEAGIVALIVAYPCILAALIGGLFLSR